MLDKNSNLAICFVYIYYNHILMFHFFSSRGPREQPEIREAESSTQGVRYSFLILLG